MNVRMCFTSVQLNDAFVGQEGGVCCIVNGYMVGIWGVFTVEKG